MSQHSEERVSDSIAPIAATARVIPFERPQSELQKAVQQRALESIQRERDRANQRPPAWRRILVLALAAVPVVLTFSAALGFMGALRQFNNAMFEGAKQPNNQVAPVTTGSEPGVVFVQPYDKPAAPSQRQDAPVSPTPR